MYTFDYRCADTLEDAASVLRSADDPKLLAGGQTLLASLKLRLAQPDILIDLRKVNGLTEIKPLSDHLVSVGAMARHSQVANSPDVRRLIPALSNLAGNIGDPSIRSMGTLGGSIANNDPAADYPAALLGLGATVVTNQRRLAADEFFLGMFQTALLQDEIITAVEFPVPQCAAYVKFKHPASRFALVGAFVAKTREGAARVAITGAAPCVYRHSQAEDALTAAFTVQSLSSLEVDPDGLNSDMQASAEYRAHLVKVMIQRAVAAVVAQQGVS